MAKAGVLHDYDLMANNEPSARGQTCATCGVSPVVYQWSDYSGEGMCTRCGTPYQLKWGSEQEQAEGAYPYLNLNPEWVPIVREYYEETRRFTYLGSGFSRPGMREFVEWVDANHPEMKRKAEDESAEPSPAST